MTDELATARTEVVTKTTKKKRLTLRFAAANAHRTITLTYFRPGARGVPTYRLVLSTKDRAKLTLQAEIINEAEDLSGMPIDVVVGVPNFRFKDAVSPMILEARLKQTLAAVAPALDHRQAAAGTGDRCAEVDRCRVMGGRDDEPRVRADGGFGSGRKRCVD